MTEASIHDARFKFAARADLAEFGTGQDELRLIRNSVVDQIPVFYSDLAELSPKLHEIIGEDLNGMPTNVVNLYEEPTDIASSDVSELGYGVHYSLEAGSKLATPHLMISTGAVQAMYEVIDPLFVVHEPSETTSANQLRAASSMVAWMGLGKWAYDKVNPRQQSELDRQQSVALLLCLNENLHNNGLPSLDDAEAVSSALDYKLEMIKRRFAGAFAYRGLAHAEFEGDISQRPDLLEVRIFEGMFRAMIGRKIQQKTRLGMSAMELSLGLAFEREELVAAANFFADSEACWENSDFDPAVS